MFASQQTKISTRPSPYPPLPFHGLRLLQLLSALVTSSILCFFIYYLRDEEPPLPIPWTFIFVSFSLTIGLVPYVPSVLRVDSNVEIQLLTAALLTIPFQALTQYLHMRGTLAPRLSLYLNTALTIIWILGLSLLCWNLSWVLGHSCTINAWSSEAGMMVCRMYKALAAFAVIGTGASIATLLLDLDVNRKERRAGMYGMMAMPEKDRDDKSPWQVNVKDAGVAHDSDAGMGGALWDGDRSGITRAWKANRTLDVNDFGYTIPEGQSTYGGGRGESMEISRAHF